jgi:hypothetical protein
MHDIKGDFPQIIIYRDITTTILKMALLPLSKTNAEIPMARTNVDVRFATEWYRTEANPIFDLFRSLL